MNVVIINKSDSTGGAAVVSMRLMEALRAKGIDARMLVVEKYSDSPFVEVAASRTRILTPFMAERLKIFFANGFNREDLFKIDSASDGLPLWRHPLVRKADVVCLNWVNQGMLSLRGVEKIIRLGKPVVWTMHDMWNMTGICHHAGSCIRWREKCGDCPFLGKKARPDDLSRKVWRRKMKLYSGEKKIRFVAVSNWLANLARKSTLMAEADIRVIHNAFPMPSEPPRRMPHQKFSILIGAARLDDPVKGLPILVEATRILRKHHADEADDMELVSFGNIRDESAFEGIAIPHTHLGRITGEMNIRDTYTRADAVISTSLYETLPGTLVEGLAYGCIPVSFNRGGQRDIVDHLSTGYIAEFEEDLRKAASNIAEGILWAYHNNRRILRSRMFEQACERFDAAAVASKYIALFNQLCQ